MGVRVRGKFSPLIEKAAALELACVIVTDDPPVLVNVSDKLLLLPTWTLPNARLVGFAVSAPCAIPVPESGTESVGLLALELMVSVPLAAPAADGAKVALKVVPCPALSVIGRLGPVKLNPLPLAAALDTVTLSSPVFVTVTDTL